MKRRSSCGGPFGLIVHRKWNLRFCSKACKKAYEYEQAEAIRQAQQNWRPTVVSLRSETSRGATTRCDCNKHLDWKMPWLKRFSTIHR